MKKQRFLVCNNYSAGTLLRIRQRYFSGPASDWQSTPSVSETRAIGAVIAMTLYNLDCPIIAESFRAQ
jgi:hypothetical protein